MYVLVALVKRARPMALAAVLLSFQPMPASLAEGVAHSAFAAQAEGKTGNGIVAQPLAGALKEFAAQDLVFVRSPETWE